MREVTALTGSFIYIIALIFFFFREELMLTKKSVPRFHLSSIHLKAKFTVPGHMQ